ncbi:hypothetical protein GGD62_008331 [Bradyrhizobium sp. ERR14]|nr:hypothetical protein [Bradyrhizobium sp. ERR14]
MLLLSPIAAAFAGAAFIIGLRLAVFPLLNPIKWYWRALLLGTAALLSWRYVLWRFIETLAPLDWTAAALFSWGFAMLEALTVLSSSIALFILSRVKERTAEADQHSEWWLPGEAPRVDVFITTYKFHHDLQRAVGRTRAHDHWRDGYSLSSSSDFCSRRRRQELGAATLRASRNRIPRTLG